MLFISPALQQKVCALLICSVLICMSGKYLFCLMASPRTARYEKILPPRYFTVCTEQT